MAETLSGMLGSFTWLFLATGGLVLVWGLFGLGRALLSPHPEERSVGTPLMTTAGGVVLIFGSILFPWLLGTGSSNKPAQAGPTGTPSPSATSPTPAPSAPVPQSNPISLPKVENAETLWVIPVVLLVLIAVYVLVKLLVRDVTKRRAEKAAREAREARLDRKWQEVVDRHKELEKRFLEAETDWDMLFKFPALTDVSVPTTAAMVRAMQAAADADSHRPENLDATTDFSKLPYPQAVREFGLAWDAALRHAQKVGQSGIPKEERQQIAQIGVV